MDDLSTSRSLDNIFSQDEEAFLNMLLSHNNTSSNESTSPANDNLSQSQLIEQVPLPSLPEQQIEEGQAVPASTFFFNGESATEPTLVEDDSTVADPNVVSTSMLDLPLLLPVKPELEEEPLFSALPDIFPTIEDVGTPESDELSDAMPTSPSTSSATSPKIKKEMKTEKKKKKQPIKEEKKKRPVKQNKRDARPGKKQKIDNLTPFIRSLKGMNSIELEEYASTRALTSQQQAELKDWIRKIKNRESASNSRKNRKSHQQVLEAQLEELDTRNEELQEEIKELEIENRVLRGELVKFRELIEQSNLGKAFEEYNKRNKARALAGTKTTASSATSKVTPTIASPKMSVAATSAAPVPTPLPRQFGSEVAVVGSNLGVDEASSPLKADVPAEGDASAIATPTATLPTGTKDQIESYRAQTLARLGEAVAKMVQKGKARREDVALVLYLLIVLHQCGQFLTTPAQLAQQMGIPSSEAVSVVV